MLPETVVLSKKATVRKGSIFQKATIRNSILSKKSYSQKQLTLVGLIHINYIHVYPVRLALTVQVLIHSFLLSRRYKKDKSLKQQI